MSGEIPKSSNCIPDDPLNFSSVAKVYSKNTFDYLVVQVVFHKVKSLMSEEKQIFSMRYVVRETLEILTL